MTLEINISNKENIKNIKKLTSKIYVLEHSQDKFWNYYYPNGIKETSKGIIIGGIGFPFFFGWIILGAVGGFTYHIVQDCRISICKYKIKKLTKN
jgi:hypothetical protein